VAGVALARYAGTPCWLVFNIGDSRVYLMRSGELRQISVDHSVGSHSGKGDRPRLTRALGAGLGSPVADQWLIRARVGDRMLVCTDGLSNAVEREQLAAAMVGDDDPQETVQRLLDEALAAGGRDNVSLAVVDCLEVIQVAGGELDDVMSLDESEEETVSWNHDDTIPDPEGK
jgi:protein serine/threonine phosphatase